MKSVFIALLVICVLQAVYTDAIAPRSDPYANYQPKQERESLIEIIENIANQTIELAKDSIKVVQVRIEQLYQEIYEKIFGVQQNAQIELNSLLDGIERPYDYTIHDNNSCVQEYINQAKNVIANGREEIAKCIVTAMGEADKISETIVPYAESIGTLIANITGVIETCSTSSNPISAAICITQHVTDVSNAVSGIIHDSQEAMKLASVQIYALVQNTQGCVNTSVDTVKAEVAKIVASINECIGN